MTKQHITSKIAVITQQLAALREQATSANAAIRGYLEKRDKLNEKLKKLRQEIRELKNERDKLNAKVQSLKQQRDESRIKIKVYIELIKEHGGKVAELKKKAPRENCRGLQREFDAIEWKIQTTPLDMQEEKRLMERVKQLETQLSVYKRVDQHVKKILELRREFEPFKASADAVHTELTKMAKRSQEIHVKMLAKIAELKDVKVEADSLHNSHIQARKQVKPLYEEIEKLSEQKRNLQASLREEDEKRKKNLEQALKEMLVSQAKDKLRRGEKLSWDEFKALMDESSDDTQAQD